MGLLIWHGILIGLAATVAMDIWAVILHLVFKQNKPNWAPAGRWFHCVARGHFLHQDLGAIEAFPQEQAVGWFGHYAVGVAYGIIFALIVGPAWFAAPTFIPAWIFGIVTIGAGWFIMQPGMGLGIAASKTPNPNKVRLLNFAAHTVFALGMYVSALILVA